MKRSLSLLFVFVLLAALLPVEAHAKGKVYEHYICACYDPQSDNIIEKSFGIPYLLETDAGSHALVITDDDLYQGDEYEYGCILSYENEAILLLDYFGSYGGLSVWLADVVPGDYYYSFGMAATNEDYTAIAYTSDGGYEKIGCYFKNIKETPNDIVLFDSLLSIYGEFGDLTMPAPVLDSEGDLVGVITEIDGGYYAYALTFDTGSTAETEPPETEAPKTEPPTTEPPASLPSEPDHTEPVPTRGREPEPTEPKPVRKPEPDNTLILLIGGAAAVAVIAAVVFMLTKKKKPDQPPSQPLQSIPQDVPVPAGPTDTGSAPGADDWEPIPGGGSAEQFVYAVVTAGALQGQSIRITDDGALVGRDPGAALRYPENAPGISRNHCRIFWQNNELKVEDLGSSSGTYMERCGKLQANMPVSLDEGDVIYLGSRDNALTVRIQ